MYRPSVKSVAALVGALALLSLVWVLLAQAASPRADPTPATQSTDHLAWVSVLASPDADVERFFVGQVYRRAVGDLRRIAGHVPASALPSLASQPGVIHVPSGDPPPTPPPPDLIDVGEPAAFPDKEPSDGAPSAPKGWYENDTQGVHETWSTLGVTGTGVTIAVLDSGVDFGNPALAGRYAIQPATTSGTQVYAGWPIAFDDRSLSSFLDRPDMPWPVNWGWYVNANHVVSGSGQFTFTHPLSSTYVCTTTGDSMSGRYLLGLHPDSALNYAPVLVVDKNASGVYDTVYVDLDSDGIFETSMDKNSPVGTLDRTGDGVPDVSAGMLYWIADGANPPPGAEAVYGPGAPVPAAGTLLAFMIDDTSSYWRSYYGGGHGTMCAGTAAGYDDGNVFTTTSQVASFYSYATYGPLVQGPAPGARIIAVGNVYAPGGSLDAWYLFTMMGYDGVPASGDEPQIVTLSFGSGEVDNDTWDWESRYLVTLNLTYGANSPLFVQSAGNGGPGYGTLIPPKAATGLIVGGSVQYGTYNAWGISETVSLPARVNSGDVAPFSGRGPGADGVRAVDLTANGMLGTGAYPLNYFGDGARAYAHWRGTSRSAPVVGGMAALAAQGFRQAHGRFPTYAELRMLLINGANDLGYDPLAQGAGQANAFRSTQLALAQYGVTIDPPAAVAGDFRGESYPSFAAGLARGQSQTLTFTVANSSTVPITVELDAQHLVEIARYTATTPTLHDTATNYGNGAPDYALDLTAWITAHPDADLMIVRTTESFEHFDTIPPTPPSPSNTWRLMAYNWWDDGDGKWWDDVNGDGRLNWPGEIDGGDEWMRFSHSDFGTSSVYLNGTQQEVRVAQPYTRSIGVGSGGVWAGAAHITRGSGDNSTTLAFEVIFYRRADWAEVTLSADSFSVAAGAQATFQATVSVPADAAYGLYQGIIVVADAGREDVNAAYHPHRTIIPLTWQVWPSGDSFTLGGAPPTGTPYDNGRIGGGFGWQVKESGDWRFYGFDLHDPPEGSVILAHSVWEDAPTDLDTIIFGPTADEFSAADPVWFGPYSLDRVGGTTRAGSPGAWEFSTVTGGTEDWASAPAQDGLHVLAQQAVLFGGHQSAVPFTTTVGLLTVEPHVVDIDPTTCNPSCTVTMTLRATLDIPGGITGTHTFTQGAFSFAGLPTEVAAGETVTFTVHVDQAPPPGQRGLLALGPLLLPEALQVEVRIGQVCYLPLVMKDK